MTSPLLTDRPQRRAASFPRLALAAVLAFGLTLISAAADAGRKTYNLPAGEAVETLKQFSAQSGEQIVYPVTQVTGAKTNAVKGDLTAREALDGMLAGTGLEVVQDEKTGALAVKKAAGPNGARAGRASGDSENSDRIEPALIRLAEYTVLGSRIRQTEIVGPSPVSSYNNDYIRESGAMTLADFINRIPQNYSGIASGRGSAPNELNPDFGQRTETSSPAFNFVLGAADSPPAQTGVSGVNLRGLGSASTLVLVDGRRVAQSGSGNRSTDTRQGFVNLDTIPLGMIDHIEVTNDGASAIYGADAVAGVINIVLKKNYTGSELATAYKATEHGGGRERNISLFSGFSYGQLSGTIGLDYYDRQSLKASDRSFSANQNHSAIAKGTLTPSGATAYGVDYRLNWGYPAVIQASGGTVPGEFNLLPGIRVVAVPAGSATTPSVSQFSLITTPASGTVVNASAQRRLNTASFLDLIPASKRDGANGNLKYVFNSHLEGYVSYRTSITRSLFNSQPTTSITGGFGTAAALPAAFNPFNQNVTVGMVLAEWGSTSQTVRTIDNAITGGLHGQTGNSWQWDIATTWQTQNLQQITRNFNGAGFAGLLTAVDASKRFNPFIDASAPGAPSQAALLETLSVYPSLDTTSHLKSLDLETDGDLFGLPGGEVKAAFGGTVSQSAVDSYAVSYSSAVTPVASSRSVFGTQDTHAVFTEFNVPVFGKPNSATLLQRLDFQLAGRFEEVGAFSKFVPKFGVSWAPFKSLLVRGSVSQGFRAPGVTEYLTAPSTTTSSVTDPLRTPATTTGVIIAAGSSPTPKPELSDNKFAGIVYEPAYLAGFTFQANYYQTKQKDVYQLMTAQTIVNNESLFPDRVFRTAPNATDISLNQPGQITQVNRQFVNFGLVYSESAEFNVEYKLPGEKFGRWRVSAMGLRNLKSYRQVAPGQPAVILEDDTGSPPKWTYNSALYWSGGNWNASAFLWHLDGFSTNSAGSINTVNNSAIVYYPIPAVNKLDLRLGYVFTQGIWHGHAKGLRILASVDNVADQKPPFSDTVWGYNAGLHALLVQGRAYGLSLTIPLN